MIIAMIIITFTSINIDIIIIIVNLIIIYKAEVMTDYFNRMIQVCNKKCVVKFNEPDLQVGEMSCVDRCVGKYMQAQEKVN